MSSAQSARLVRPRAIRYAAEDLPLLIVAMLRSRGRIFQASSLQLSGEQTMSERASNDLASLAGTAVSSAAENRSHEYTSCLVAMLIMFCVAAQAQQLTKVDLMVW